MHAGDRNFVRDTKFVSWLGRECNISHFSSEFERSDSEMVTRSLRSLQLRGVVGTALKRRRSF